MRLLIYFIFFMVTPVVNGQTFDDLRLSTDEIPSDYKSLDYPIDESRIETYYRYTKTYNSLIGEVINKEFQAFQNKKGNGTIFYFEFKEKIKSEDLLPGLLWGEDESSKKKLTEYVVLNNILVVWRFDHRSELKAISYKKVKALQRRQR